MLPQDEGVKKLGRQVEAWWHGGDPVKCRITQSTVRGCLAQSACLYNDAMAMADTSFRVGDGNKTHTGLTPQAGRQRKWGGHPRRKPTIFITHFLLKCEFLRNRCLLLNKQEAPGYMLPCRAVASMASNFCSSRERKTWGKSGKETDQHCKVDSFHTCPCQAAHY